MVAVSKSLTQFHVNMNIAEHARKRPLLPDTEDLSDKQDGHQ